ncbi:MAG: DUF2993 domain-containing protein [Limnochordales bacterium]|nr:DUF2993 domain-containing protein [Limnochordales bacterium]
MRRRRDGWGFRAGLVLIGLVAVVLLSAEIWLPGWASTLLEEALRQELAPAGFVEVKARSYPSFRLLAGRIDRFRAEGREFAVGGLRVEALIVEGQGVTYDSPSLYRRGEFRLRTADSLRVTLVVNERALNEFFWQQADPQHRFRLSFDGGQAKLQGSFSVLGREFNIMVSGRLIVKGSDRVAFEPERLSFEKLQLPAFVLKMLAERWVIRLDFSSLPFPLELTDVRLTGGRLYVYGRQAKMQATAGEEDA